jgi:hypothetical protein
VNQPAIPAPAELSQPVRQKRIQQNTGDAFLGLGALLDDSDAIYDHPRFMLQQEKFHGIQICGIAMFEHVPLLQKSDVANGSVMQRSPNRAVGIGKALLKALKHFVSEHTGSAQDQDFNL